MRLKTWQSLFMKSLLTGEQAEALLNKLIVYENGLTANEQLAVYQNSAKMGLIRSLQKLYPVVNKLVGELFFVDMAEKYVAKHPSLTPNQNDYGLEFPDFIDSYKAVQSLPYLTEVALLEQLTHQVLLSHSLKHFDLATLKRVPLERQQHLVFKLQHCVRLLKAEYAVDRIWDFCRESNPRQFIGQLREERPVLLLLYRTSVGLVIERLTQTEYMILSAFRSGESLASVCAKLLKRGINADDFTSNLPKLTDKLEIIL